MAIELKPESSEQPLAMSLAVWLVKIDAVERAPASPPAKEPDTFALLCSPGKANPESPDESVVTANPEKLTTLGRILARVHFASIVMPREDEGLETKPDEEGN